MKSVNCSFLKNKNHVATSVREECFSPYTQGFHPGEGNTLVLSGWTLSAPLLSTPRRGLGHSIRQWRGWNRLGMLSSAQLLPCSVGKRNALYQVSPRRPPQQILTLWRWSGHRQSISIPSFRNRGYEWASRAERWEQHREKVGNSPVELRTPSKIVAAYCKRSTQLISNRPSLGTGHSYSTTTIFWREKEGNSHHFLKAHLSGVHMKG